MGGQTPRLCEALGVTPTGPGVAGVLGLTGAASSKRTIRRETWPWCATPICSETSRLFGHEPRSPAPRPQPGPCRYAPSDLESRSPAGPGYRTHGQPPGGRGGACPCSEGWGARAPARRPCGRGRATRSLPSTGSTTPSAAQGRLGEETVHGSNRTPRRLLPPRSEAAARPSLSYPCGPRRLHAPTLRTCARRSSTRGPAPSASTNTRRHNAGSFSRTASNTPRPATDTRRPIPPRFIRRARTRQLLYRVVERREETILAMAEQVIERLCSTHPHARRPCAPPSPGTPARTPPRTSHPTTSCAAAPTHTGRHRGGQTRDYALQTRRRRHQHTPPTGACGAQTKPRPRARREPARRDRERHFRR